jgi:hypothetical protein
LFKAAATPTGGRDQGFVGQLLSGLSGGKPPVGGPFGGRSGG